MVFLDWVFAGYPLAVAHSVSVLFDPQYQLLDFVWLEGFQFFYSVADGFDGSGDLVAKLFGYFKNGVLPLPELGQNNQILNNTKKMRPKNPPRTDPVNHRIHLLLIHNKKQKKSIIYYILLIHKNKSIYYISFLAYKN